MGFVAMSNDIGVIAQYLYVVMVHTDVLAKYLELMGMLLLSAPFHMLPVT